MLFYLCDTKASSLNHTTQSTRILSAATNWSSCRFDVSWSSLRVNHDYVTRNCKFRTCGNLKSFWLPINPVTGLTFSLMRAYNCFICWGQLYYLCLTKGGGTTFPVVNFFLLMICLFCKYIGEILLTTFIFSRYHRPVAVTHVKCERGI